jgi:hypothetical protein
LKPALRFCVRRDKHLFFLRTSTFFASPPSEVREGKICLRELFASAVHKSAGSARSLAGRSSAAARAVYLTKCDCSALCRLFFIIHQVGWQGETKLYLQHRLHPDRSDTQVAYAYFCNNYLFG